MSKIKVMLDNNILDELAKLDDESLEKVITHSEMLIPRTQWDEFNRYKDTKLFDINKFNRIKSIIKMCPIKQSAYFGFSPDFAGFDQGCFMSESSRKYEKEIEEYMNKYKKPTIDKPYPNKADAHLASLAKSYGCITLTQDGTGKKRKGLYQAIKNCGGEVLSFEEFCEKIDSQEV